MRIKLSCIPKFITNYSLLERAVINGLKSFIQMRKIVTVSVKDRMIPPKFHPPESQEMDR